MFKFIYGVFRSHSFLIRVHIGVMKELLTHNAPSCVIEFAEPNKSHKNERFRYAE